MTFKVWTLLCKKRCTVCAYNITKMLYVNAIEHKNNVYYSQHIHKHIYRKVTGYSVQLKNLKIHLRTTENSESGAHGEHVNAA